MFGLCGVDLDRRLAHEAEHHVLRQLAVALLRIDPVILLLSGLDVHAAELALAVAVDDLAGRNRPHLAALASGRRLPELDRIVGPPRRRRQARHRQVLAGVLLRAVDVVGELLVGVDHVHLGGRLVVDRRPALAVVLRDVRAAVVGLDEDVRVDPG